MTDAIDTMRIFSVHPEAVEYELRQISGDYNNSKTRSDDIGFAHTAAIPVLYKYTVKIARTPSYDELLSHLMQYCEEKYRNDPRAEARARKLVKDFYRDLHTFGLLTHGPIFASVAYQKGLDIRYNVDFLASLQKPMLIQCLEPQESVGVQAAMLHPRNWEKEGEDFIDLKQRRRRKRRETIEWKGKTYWLTNKDRYYDKAIGGVWLFGPDHIRDLVEEIKGDLQYREPIPIAIRQSVMSF